MNANGGAVEFKFHYLEVWSVLCFIHVSLAGKTLNYKLDRKQD
jgi:hypothetical protein